MGKPNARPGTKIRGMILDEFNAASGEFLEGCEIYASKCYDLGVLPVAHLWYQHAAGGFDFLGRSVDSARCRELARMIREELEDEPTNSGGLDECEPG
jgi:hypothetical protein